MVEHVREHDMKIFTEDQIAEAYIEIGKYIEKVTLIEENPLFSETSLQVLCDSLKETMEKEGKFMAKNEKKILVENEEEWLRKSQLYRPCLILFSTFFELPAKPNNRLDQIKLQTLDSNKVEYLLYILKINIVKVSQMTVLPKRILKELENQLYCSLSSLMNYFVFVKENSRNEIHFSPVIYQMAEQQLIYFIEECVGSEGAKQNTYIDMKLLEDLLKKLLEFLILSIEMSKEGTIKEIYRTTNDTLILFMIYVNDSLSSTMLNSILLKFSAKLNNHKNVRSQVELTKVVE